MSRILALLLGAVLASCAPAASPTPSTPTAPTPTVSPSPTTRPTARTMPEAEAQAAVGARASATLAAIKARDMPALAAIVHPSKGVRFSPYAHIDPRRDQRFTRDELQHAFADASKRTWGEYDGIGGPIDLSVREYFDRLVYDKDFAAAPERAFNRSIGVGNTPDNGAEAYPDAVMVEYHFPAPGDTLDWRSLRLFFEEQGGTWYLVAIVHANWTI